MSDKVEEAIRFVLNAHPDIPGVGRLCQELLAHITARPITTPIIVQPRFIPPNFMARHL